jgi:hypothetical protein
MKGLQNVHFLLHQSANRDVPSYKQKWNPVIEHYAMTACTNIERSLQVTSENPVSTSQKSDCGLC